MTDTEAPINVTQILLQSRTSTDGSISPKARWVRGPPEAYSEQVRPQQQQQQEEQKSRDQDQPAIIIVVDPAPSNLPSLQPVHANRKSYMAWSWLLEDEAEREPSLCKPADIEDLQMPQLAGDEKELLCEKVAHRLVEVGRASPDIPALVQEYLRFMFLRERLEGMLTLDPSLLVDDVWQAHITLGRDYTAFCERTFGSEFELEHREIDASQPVLYKNAIGAYKHFFGTLPPATLWPGSAGCGNGKEERPYGRRTAFVRLPEQKYNFVKEC